MAKWEESNDVEELFLHCNFVPQCSICGNEMERLRVKKQKFALHDPVGDPNEKRGSHALDIQFWCPHDGAWEIFGVAISESHYKKLNDYWKGTKEKVKKKAKRLNWTIVGENK